MGLNVGLWSLLIIYIRLDLLYDADTSYASHTRINLAVAFFASGLEQHLLIICYTMMLKLVLLFISFSVHTLYGNVSVQLIRHV